MKNKSRLIFTLFGIIFTIVNAAAELDIRKYPSVSYADSSPLFRRSRKEGSRTPPLPKGRWICRRQRRRDCYGLKYLLFTNVTATHTVGATLVKEKIYRQTKIFQQQKIDLPFLQLRQVDFCVSVIIQLSKGILFDNCAETFFKPISAVKNNKI